LPANGASNPRTDTRARRRSSGQKILYHNYEIERLDHQDYELLLEY
jgi:hypothetical protein